MTEQEIKKGVKEVCEISKEIATLYSDDNALIAKLNSVPHDEIQKIYDYYSSRSGVIVDLRKDVLKYLKEGNKLNLYTFDEFIVKHKTGKENQYRAYKNNFSIFFPIITFYGHIGLSFI